LLFMVRTLLKGLSEHVAEQRLDLRPAGERRSG
jgi:hypothetical protein